MHAVLEALPLCSLHGRYLFYTYIVTRSLSLNSFVTIYRWQPFRGSMMQRVRNLVQHFQDIFNYGNVPVRDLLLYLVVVSTIF